MLRRLSFFLAAAWLAAACASYTDETREIRSLYRAENYRGALAKLDESDLKEQDRNKLLYQLERAMILDRLGEGQKARALFVEADKLADRLYTVSLSRTAASFVMSDAQSDYDGEDYEKVAIHTQMALSFIGDADLKSARVEARKINSKLEEINKGYEDNKNRYAEDAFARYLSGSIYEARGELDDAIIDYARAVELYQKNFAEFVDGGVPDGLVKAYWRLLKKRNRPDKLTLLEKAFPKMVEEAKAEDKSLPEAGEIVVVHEAGHIATKSTQEFVIGVGKQVVRFSFPVIKTGSHGAWRESGVSVAGRFHGGDNVSDMDKIAHATLEDRRLRMVAKQMARLLAKGQLTEQAYKNFGIVGGIAANVFTVVTETADTRSWTLLPEGYFITRVRLKPGTYNVEVKTNGRVGQIKTVKVDAGKVDMLRDAG